MDGFAPSVDLIMMSPGIDHLSGEDKVGGSIADKSKI